MTQAPQTFGAFGAGVNRPTISIINIAKTRLGFDLKAFVAVLQRYFDEDFSPVWGVPCKFQLVTGPKVPKGSYGIIIADDADQPGALGYHEVSDDGMPISYAFAKTALQAGESLTVTISHEATEMTIDPAINLWAQSPPTRTNPNGFFWAYETADAVEDSAYKIDGFEVSNFLYPSAFEGFRKAKSVKFDHLSLTSKPFQIMAKGYSIISRGGQPQSVFASLEKGRAFLAEDRRMHRSQMRQPPIQGHAALANTLMFTPKNDEGILLLSDLP